MKRAPHISVDTKPNGSFHIDPLYGYLSLSDDMAKLAATPAMQRLRHIRLSNIDSRSMPGLSSVSRYEHAIGTAYLASLVGEKLSLDDGDQKILCAAAMIHDSAIPPFGHLFEETMNYFGEPIGHEDRWSKILGGSDKTKIGGIDFQIFCGRAPGLHKWVESQFAIEWEANLLEIANSIQGKGKIGPLIKGAIDLDNIDNITRVAYHIGLDFNADLPRKIVESIVGIDTKQKRLIFGADSASFIEEILSLRRKVYCHLMQSREDFIGKTMIIKAGVLALESKILTLRDWNLTDFEFITKLHTCEDERISSLVNKWLCNELPGCSDLLWLTNNAPSFKELSDFSKKASDKLGKDLFSYRIKDKRTRLVSVDIQSIGIVDFGEKSEQWLLGVISNSREKFTKADNMQIADLACEFFNCTLVEKASGPLEIKTDELF